MHFGDLWVSVFNLEIDAAVNRLMSQNQITNGLKL